MGRVLLLLVSLLSLSACANSPSYDPQDPLEKINRPIFKFNLKADKYVLKPVAKTYVKVVPDPARKGISNFFDNLFYPTTIVNDLLQAKFKQSGQDTLRFVLNTTVGIVGLIDVATDQGLPLHNEDLGQTLGHWGVGPGWYLMLPLLGASSNRDLVGFVGDGSFFYDNPSDPLTYIDSINFVDRLFIAGGQAIVDRSKLLGSEKVLRQQLDPYVFFRTVYLDHRMNLVYDGNPPKDPDLDFGDEDASDSDEPGIDAGSTAAPTPPASR